MRFDIRPAERADIDMLVTIENAAFTGDRLSRRSFRHLLRRNMIIVADSGGAASGYAVALRRRGSGIARLYSIAVAPMDAGKGIAHALLQAAEAGAAKAGCRTLRLEVREDNVRAIALYEKRGYRRFARRETYYQDGAAALRYEKHLCGGEGERP